MAAVFTHIHTYKRRHVSNKTFLMSRIVVLAELVMAKSAHNRAMNNSGSYPVEGDNFAASMHLTFGFYFCLSLYIQFLTTNICSFYQSILSILIVLLHKSYIIYI